MPRGNDAAAVGAENLAQYGQHANAEELIRAQAATVDPALQKVLITALNEDATAEVRGDLAGTAKKFDLAEGETVIDAAVRGNAIVVVIEEADGRYRKAVTGYTDDWKPPTLTDQERVQYEAAQAQLEADQQVAKIRDAAADRVRQAQADADAQVAEEEARIRRAAEEKIAAARHDDAATTAASPPPGDADLSSLTGAELDDLAERLGVPDYQKKSKVEERRKTIAAFQKG